MGPYPLLNPPRSRHLENIASFRSFRSNEIPATNRHIESVRIGNRIQHHLGVLICNRCLFNPHYPRKPCSSCCIHCCSRHIGLLCDPIWICPPWKVELLPSTHLFLLCIVAHSSKLFSIALKIFFNFDALPLLPSFIHTLDSFWSAIRSSSRCHCVRGIS